MSRNQAGGAGLKFFLALIILGALGMGVSFVMINYLNPENDKKGYDNKEKLGNEPCAAQEPECGYCPGTVIGDDCYWNES